MRPHQYLAPLILAASACTHAHQDVRIDIMPNGELVGLPDLYAPATLRVDFQSTPEDSHIGSIELSIAGVRTVVPSCASALIMSRSISEVHASASWYHTRSRLPPYLTLSFLDPGADPTSWPLPRFSLTFNLETSRLISMVVHVARKNPESEQRLPVDLFSSCLNHQIDLFYSPLAQPSAPV